MALIKPGEDFEIGNKGSHIGSLTTKGHDAGNIFSCTNSFHSKQKWILDSGATDHVAMSLECFTSYNKIRNIKVNLPNGTCVNATHKGTIKLNDNITVHNLLFILDFNYNLISTSRLIMDSHVHITFTNKGCFIQNQLSRRMIGSASLHEGLYTMFDMSSNVSFVNSGSSIVWHKRLGHLSDKRLHVLHNKYNYIEYGNEYCDICHMCKQRKLSFSISESHAVKCFDVIHTDIWRPSPTPSLHGHHYFLTIIDDHSRY